MADRGIIGVCLLLGVCAVVLALLLMAGDVERNPGPTGKEGNSWSQRWLCCNLIGMFNTEWSEGQVTRVYGVYSSIAVLH